MSLTIRTNVTGPDRAGQTRIRALVLPLTLALALIWVQTAAAWHETGHALHGHDIEDIACEILSGTADQPADTAVTPRVTESARADGIDSPRYNPDDILFLRFYLARAPPV